MKGSGPRLVHSEQEIKDLIDAAGSDRRAFWDFYLLLKAEQRAAMLVSRERIRANVDMVCKELGGQYRTGHAYVIAEATASALGYVIYEEDER